LGGDNRDITPRPPSRASERVGRQLLRSCPGRAAGVCLVAGSLLLLDLKEQRSAAQRNVHVEASTTPAT
jgi:hypothetical protein